MNTANISYIVFLLSFSSCIKPFHSAPTTLRTSLACWMANPSPVPHLSTSDGPHSRQILETMRTNVPSQSWIVAISDEEEEMEEGGTSKARDHEARELHEDDFESDEEPQVEGDKEFELNSDDERLLDIIDDDNMEGYN
ncbi:hypothetical protein L6452_32871 [Arctium lappa]|uniref:Uncharacterized protein n=1 Tax=Arctium lappa TaxID=4217 RepID=A0ACB8Z612_ARCLA|nr:hypothetical protein L6452_32871 [Arctium lappa]